MKPEIKAYKKHLTAKGYSHSSIRRYVNNVEGFISWRESENIPQETVSHNDLLHYIRYKQKTVQQNTIAFTFNALKKYFDWQAGNGELPVNPASNITIKGVKRKKLYTILTKSELEKLYHNYTFNASEENKRQNWHKASQLAFIRNKIMIGLLVYQGVTAGELKRLTLKDVDLRGGAIKIPGGRKSNERTLTLESVQMLDLMEYTLKSRDEILELTGKQSDHLFTGTGTGTDLQGVLQILTKKIKQLDPKIISLQQIRASAITHWLKTHNLRETQYKAGHRYVSSTEAYLVNDLEGLQEDITKFHPLNGLY